jgi:hypothetical protein
VQSLERDVKAAQEALAKAAGELKRLPVAIDARGATENGALLLEAHATLAGWISKGRGIIEGFQSADVELGPFFDGLAANSDARGSAGRA